MTSCDICRHSGLKMQKRAGDLEGSIPPVFSSFRLSIRLTTFARGFGGQAGGFYFLSSSNTTCIDAFTRSFL
jgi:hypothetical protein